MKTILLKEDYLCYKLNTFYNASDKTVDYLQTNKISHNVLCYFFPECPILSFFVIRRHLAYEHIQDKVAAFELGLPK